MVHVAGPVFAVAQNDAAAQIDVVASLARASRLA
jgi:hypothetical protein